MEVVILGGTMREVPFQEYLEFIKKHGLEGNAHDGCTILFSYFSFKP